MGLDFIRRAAPSFRKSWDRDSTQLSQPTLFTRYPECRTRTVVAQFNDRFPVVAGDRIVVCVDGQTLVLIREIVQIGVVTAPPPDLYRAMRDSGDCAVGNVVRINPLSGTADVEIE